MRIEEKTQKFADYLGEICSKLSIKQKQYAKSLLEDILTEISIEQRRSEKLALELAGTKNEDYPDLLIKTVTLLQIMEFDIIDLTMINRYELEFIVTNFKSIKKSGEITTQRINNIIGIIKYHYQTTGNFPESMKDIIDSFNEIKCSKIE
jgi:hypothetical protein